ncbi:MAG: amidohydrolase family protein [Patescibacteria group bacterium]|jgi:dihydroorotase
METQISIFDPLDAHLHIRQGQMMKDVLPYTAAHCGAAVIMGNLAEPIDDLDRLLCYRYEVQQVIDELKLSFTPIMTIMLTPHTTVEIIRACAPEAKVLKLIPANTSTNSKTGVALGDLRKCYPILEELQKHEMIFSIHAEQIMDSGKLVAEEDREEAALPFVERIIRDFPGLKIIIEHVSTRAACQLILESPKNVAGTITAHHAIFSDLFLKNPQGGIRPEFYCKPVLKSEKNRETVAWSMLSDCGRFFFGSDSAPHPWAKKFESDPPAAGIFSAPSAIPFITEAFFQAGRLDGLENFLSVYGRKFYGLPYATKKVTLRRDPDNKFTFPLTVGEDKIPVLAGGHTQRWFITR